MSDLHMRLVEMSIAVDGACASIENIGAPCVERHEKDGRAALNLPKCQGGVRISYVASTTRRIVVKDKVDSTETESSDDETASDDSLD